MKTIAIIASVCLLLAACNEDSPADAEGSDPVHKQVDKVANPVTMAPASEPRPERCETPCTHPKSGNNCPATTWCCLTKEWCIYDSSCQGGCEN